jgi:hypothetical protein
MPEETNILEDLLLIDPIPQKKKFFHKTETSTNAVQYLDNKEFSQSLARYVTACNLAENAGKKLPVIPNDIASSLMKIVNNLAKSHNFSSYTWLDEMKADAIENCIRYIRKYNIDAPTRTGKPEAFSYFTRIAYFAFLRRIKLEKNQIEIKDSIINKYNIDIDFYTSSDDGHDGDQDADYYMDNARQKRES